MNGKNSKTSTRIETFMGLCFMNGGKVFGGFVRDMLSGDAPNDIDMIFPTMREAMEFFGAAYKAGLVKGILPKPESQEIPLGYKLMGTFGSEHVMRFEPIQLANAKVEQDTLTGEMERNVLHLSHIDLVVGTGLETPDYSVNRLCLDRKGIHAIEQGDVYTWDTIMLCREKQFRRPYLSLITKDPMLSKQDQEEIDKAFKQNLEERKEKLLAKGWTEKK